MIEELKCEIQNMLCRLAALHQSAWSAFGMGSEISLEILHMCEDLERLGATVEGAIVRKERKGD